MVFKMKVTFVIRIASRSSFQLKLLVNSLQNSLICGFSHVKDMGEVKL